MKKLLKLLSNKIVLTALSLLIQMAIIGVVVVYLSYLSIWILVGFHAISFLVCIYIISRETNPGYKLAWVVPVLVFPIFGGCMYLFIGRQHIRRKLRRNMETVSDRTQVLLNLTNAHIEGMVPDIYPVDSKITDYITRQTSYPLYTDTQTQYFRLGEDYAAAIIADLKKAERFIFMEYFIIEPGKFWDEIYEVLKQKAADGVDVRVIYDDVGCLLTLPRGFAKKLRRDGIKVMVFNKLKPSFDVRMNNRSHRKITVIDGDIGYTGGINLADEYVNAIQKFGHWKDTGMRFQGFAVWSFTVMFLSFWTIQYPHDIDYESFFPRCEVTGDPKAGFVQPLTGGPGKEGQVIENTFMQIIGTAADYVYINTPYLVLDNEIVTELCLAARSGVDVRITMPHVPDKRYVFMMSRSFYPVLLKAGVRIYEYTPGFVHAKSIVSDDEFAYIGTCNMDYRSFYLHYECGAVLYKTPTVADMKADYLETLASCQEITYAQANDVTIFTRMARSILRLIAPLL